MVGKGVRLSEENEKFMLSSSSTFCLKIFSRFSYKKQTGNKGCRREEVENGRNRFDGQLLRVSYRLLRSLYRK